MATKIYYIPNTQHISYFSSGDLRKDNLPINRFDTIIYQGSNNMIDFSIRNRDRKPINLLDKTLTIFIQNIENSKHVITKKLEKLDVYKGFVRLTLSEEEISEWDVGFYQYAITVIEDNGREGFAFVDQVHRVTGEFELKPNAIMSTTTSIKEITNFLEDEKSPTESIFVSGAVEFGIGTVHTVAFYLNEFMGEVEVQVTLDQGIPDNENNWATHSTFNTIDLTSAPLTAIKYFNIIGNYTFVRFLYDPHSLNEGTIAKVLYN